MKKMFLLGLAVQVVIVLISYITENMEIIRNANIFIIIFVLSTGAAMNIGTSGFFKGSEYVGLKQNEKDKMISHQASRITKLTFFILPATIVLIIYLWYSGFSIEDLFETGARQAMRFDFKG